MDLLALTGFVPFSSSRHTTSSLDVGILVVGESVPEPPGIDCLDTEGPGKEWPPPLLIPPGAPVVGHGGVQEVDTPHPSVVLLDEVGAGDIHLPAFCPGVPPNGTDWVQAMDIGSNVDSFVVLPADLATTHYKV